jgi:hypothetical protein
MNKYNLILEQSFNESKKHCLRLNKAFDKIKSLIPLNQDRYLKLNDDEIAFIDQYIFRFSKLQDALGNKLFKAVLLLLGEDLTNKSFIDMFNRLEQLGIIKNYDLWVELRKLRNELAHDYEDDPIETSEKINKVFDKKDVLEKFFIDIERFLVAKGFDF